MQIDRRRFLALTAGIAAAHCAPSPPPVVHVPAEDVQVGAAAAPTVASPEAAPEVPAATASADAAADPGGAAPGPPIKAQACAPSENMKGAPKSCLTLAPPGPSCESFSDTKSQCSAIRSLLKPRVAEKAVACHLAKSGTPAICKFNLVTDCATEALGSACLDPPAVSACKRVLAKCGQDQWSAMNADACEAAVSAVSDAHRARFISCITEFCRFETCFYHLGPSSEATSPARRLPPVPTASPPRPPAAKPNPTQRASDRRD